MGVVEEPRGLDQMTLRECATVVDVDGADDDLERLKAMGVCEGRTVEVIKHGDPLVLKIYGTRLGVSARLAQCVRVKPCARNCSR